MNKHIDQLINDLKDEILISSQFTDPLESYNNALKSISKANSLLKDFLEHQKLTDHEEIEIFKTIKPQIESYKIEEGLKYNIVINKPVGTKEAKIRYLEEQLRALQSFFRLYGFYYLYYKNRFKELDDIYFLRSSGPLIPPLSEIPDSGNDYSTPMSYLFARFIAYERIQNFMIEQIALLKNNIFATAAVPDLPLNMRWTGEIVNLVEVAYGLWLTGQLNNGNASLNQIIRWLEMNLDVSIGVVQKRFSEIERRKRLSITKYIDRMKEAILQKIENDIA